MRQIVIGALLWVMTALPGMAQEDEIHGVIQGQIDAFLEDDFETAFQYASPGIQGIFRTPENFGTMVRRGYPMVWRPDEVEFLDLSEVGGRMVQRVRITDGEGAVHYLGYQMIEGDDGWKIGGVSLLEAPGLSA